MPIGGIWVDRSHGPAMNMLFRVLGDFVVLVHLFWIIFLFFGAMLGVKHKGIRIIHLSGLCFAILIQVFDWYCPLTHLEFWLKSKADPGATYAGSFIAHYAEKLVYLELSRSLVFVLTIFLCAFNGWFYLKKRSIRARRSLKNSPAS